MSKKVQSLILGLMCFILTIGVFVQVKTVNNNGTTISTNQNEAQLRDQVLKMKEKYENSYDKLQKAQKELEKVRTGVTSNNEELKELEKKIKEANMLLGMTDVKGEGVTITVEDGVATSKTLSKVDLIVHNVDILNIVNELKNSGAEAIEVNNQRIVGTTSIVCDGNVITVNGEKISSPFTITAIGMPELMTTLDRAGGYLELLREDNLKATLTKSKKINIQKYTGIMAFKYAKTIS